MSKVKNIDDYLYGDRHSARKIKAGNHTVYDASGGTAATESAATIATHP